MSVYIKVHKHKDPQTQILIYACLYKGPQTQRF